MVSRYPQLVLSIALGVGVLAVGITTASAEDVFRDRVAPLISSHCIGCHGDFDDPAGDINLEQFKAQSDISKQRDVWVGVREAIETGYMPPEDSEQFSLAEKDRLMAALGKLLDAVDLGGARDPGKPILRRLTRLEYNNAIRDLFGLKIDVFNFPERIPLDRTYFEPDNAQLGDQLLIPVTPYGKVHPALLREAGLPGENPAEHGFTNRGDTLNISPILIEKYLDLSEQLLESEGLAQASPWAAALLGSGAIRTAIPERDVTARYSRGRFGSMFDDSATVVDHSNSAGMELSTFRTRVQQKQLSSRGGVVRADKNGKDIRFGGSSSAGLVLETGSDRPVQVVLQSSMPLAFKELTGAVPTSGVRVLTNAVPNDKVFDIKINVRDGAPQNRPQSRVTEAAFNIISLDGVTTQYVEIKAHFSGGGLKKLMEPVTDGAGKGNRFVRVQAPQGEWIERIHFDGSRVRFGDHVAFDDLTLFFGDVSSTWQPFDGISRVDLLRMFIERAFRKPLSDGEYQKYLGIYEMLRATGIDERSAARDVLRAILSSPRFIYRIENFRRDEPKVRQLDDFELASRLSFFLWNSCPDAELLAAARRGELQSDEGLIRQLRRMLNDPKAKELSESFAVQWLQLNELFGTRPDTKRFSNFYFGISNSSTLHQDMLLEPLLLFESILVEDRSVLEFIDTNYGYLNEKLIQHYGYEEELAETLASLKGKGERALIGRGTKGIRDIWFRCRLPDRRRGGVFTTGAVLTLTSTPLRTSPVYRGAWMLEAIFNNPPPPPTIAVPPLGADDRKIEEEGLSLREKLAQHREDASCSVCHDRIDPLGIALENYDPIGRWRDRSGKFEVDATGTLSHGRAYDGAVDFKDALLDRPEEFVHGFSGHLLSYALGRKLNYFDRIAIDEIVQRSARHDYRIKSVLEGVVLSYPFRHTRNLPAVPVADTVKEVSHD
ncbi:DUF1592 domain-containing protein [Stratiformator vulcanicus]|uniref:Cytochrome c domain-containing protein n=1 Tax=Stratiformator vulcanicus TaxID=2527980 RepID=A0A517R1H4_9PLAN|nr:DUF1592 domain-containing protein [Stratiformator vulcanicus]QDT37704.1 hypothetical protein Pan189_20860 [Stratiformator vulcanicus]